MAFLILLAFNLRWLPGHRKNDVGPEARSKNLFKKCDHTFQTFAKPRPLNKNRFTRGITINILVCCQYLPIEEDDEGVDMLDLILQFVHQLLHSLTVSLHLISQACVKLFVKGRFSTSWNGLIQRGNLLKYFGPKLCQPKAYSGDLSLPGVSIIVTGFPLSPAHLGLSIYHVLLWMWPNPNLPALAHVSLVVASTLCPVTKQLLPSGFSSTKLCGRPSSTFPKLDLPTPEKETFCYQLSSGMLTSQEKLVFYWIQGIQNVWNQPQMWGTCVKIVS